MWLEKSIFIEVMSSIINQNQISLIHSFLSFLVGPYSLKVVHCFLNGLRLFCRTCLTSSSRFVWRSSRCGRRAALRLGFSCALARSALKVSCAGGGGDGASHQGEGEERGTSPKLRSSFLWFTVMTHGIMQTRLSDPHALFCLDHSSCIDSRFDTASSQP